MIITRVHSKVWKNLPLIVKDRYFLRAICFKFWEFIAWRLPYPLLIHAVIRAWVETTTLPFTFEEPGPEGEFTQIIVTLENLATIDEGLE